MKKKIIIELDTKEDNEKIISHLNQWLKDNFWKDKVKVEIYENDS